MSLLDEERKLWMMLAESEAQGSNGDYEQYITHSHVNGLIRRRLRDQFQINLDQLGIEAIEEYNALMENERRIIRAQSGKAVEIAAVVQEAKDLLKK